jgi:hypothetical protein
MFAFSLTAREYNLNCTQLIQFSDSLSQPVFSGFTQAGDITPDSAVSQNIPSVFGKFAFFRTGCKPSVRLAYTDIMPFSRFAGINYRGAQIKGVKQNSDMEFRRQRSITNCFSSHLSKLTKGHFQFAGMFLFDIQQRSPWNSDTVIVQTRLQNGMADAVLAGSMMVQFANSFHLFGSFKILSVIDDEKQMLVFLGEQTAQHVQGNQLHCSRLIPTASPEKFAVVGAMSTVSQQLYEPIDSAAMTDANRQHHRPEVAIDVFRNLSFDRLEKTLQFSWDFADGSHTASLHISSCLYITYRQTKLFLFDNSYHQFFKNRSV